VTQHQQHARPSTPDLARVRERAFESQARLVVLLGAHLETAPRDLDGDDLLRWFVRHVGIAETRRFASAMDGLIDHPEAMLEDHERAFLEAFAVMMKERP
jgi:hypothetical protein